VKAELSRCRTKYGAQCVDIDLARTPDGAAFQFAEVIGIKGNTATLVIVLTGPQSDGFRQFLTRHVRTENMTRRGAFTGRAKQLVRLRHARYPSIDP
jgi:hypothetical protein